MHSGISFAQYQSFTLHYWPRKLGEPYYSFSNSVALNAFVSHTVLASKYSTLNGDYQKKNNTNTLENLDN